MNPIGLKATLHGKEVIKVPIIFCEYFRKFSVLLVQSHMKHYLSTYLMCIETKCRND